jgi:Mrp family chromosome partitioning ATPase
VLSSERLRRLLHEASTTYDWVIIDTAPVGMLPDTNLLSAMSDGAVLVVKAGTVSYTVAQRAVEAIGVEKIVGVVLNQVAAGDISATYGDTAAYYAYSRR